MEVDSSLIRALDYDSETGELHVYFHKQDWQTDRVHIGVYPYMWQQLLEASSIGSFYLNYIKPNFKIKSNNMPRKSDKILNLRVDVTKINKDWLFKGEKGTYLDLVVFYKEEPDQYETNGMVTQAVPKKVYEVDRNARGNILGNCKDWDTLQQKQQQREPEAAPNSESGAMAGDSIEKPEWADDLPF